MSTAVFPAQRLAAPPPRTASPALVWVPFVILAFASLISPAMILVVAPIVLLLGVYVAWVSPVRYGIYAIVFLGLTVDALGDGPWESPLAPFGTVLAFNLNKSLPIGALAIPGMGVILLVLLAVVIHRKLVKSRIDSAGRNEPASPLLMSLAVALGTVVFLVVLGVARGGLFQMARMQLQAFLLLLLLAYVSAMGLRHMRDYRTLGKIIVIAGVLRSGYVLWANYMLTAGTDTVLEVAATHGDSVLFACAFVLPIVRFLEKPSQRAFMWMAVLLPWLAWGMVVNARRLVWLEVAAALALYAVISRRSRMKRLLTRLAILCLPFLVAYVIVGWNTSSESAVFAPVKTFKSTADGEEDSSTLYRDLENYNLLLTLRFRPLLGSGFGKPFVEFVKLPNISFFAEYQYLPHNSILGLWAFAGAIGFLGISMPLVVAVFLASRSYERARTPDERLAAFMVIATIAIYLMHCYGDIGFSERRTTLLVGPALAIAGQLACATGAWKGRLGVPWRARASKAA